MCSKVPKEQLDMFFMFLYMFQPKLQIKNILMYFSSVVAS